MSGRWLQPHLIVERVVIGHQGSLASLDHGQHAPQLLGGVDRSGPRVGRLAADVEDVRAGLGQRHAVRDGVLGLDH